MDTGAENAVPQEGAPAPGAVLAAERERQGLSRADVAQRLHMSVSQVEALEIGDYERLPRGPFLRGFARNYARVLGLDVDAVVGLVSATAPQESAPRIVVPTQNIRFDPLGTRLSSPYVKAAGIAAVAIVLGFAAMYWWLFVRPNTPSSVTVRKPAASTPATPEPAPAAPLVVAPAPEPSVAAPPVTSTFSPLAVPPAAAPVPMAPHPEPAPVRQAAKAAPAQLPAAAPAKPSPPPAAATVPAPVSPPVASPPAAATPAVSPATGTASRLFESPAGAEGGGVIRMTFRGPAWVEVRDAGGKILLSRNHPGGSDAEVAGKPPLSVVIGNAPDVRLTYNNRAIDLEPHTRVSVARLTLP